MIELRKYIPHAVVLVVGFLIGYMLNSNVEIQTVTKTEIKHDTVTVYVPKEVTKVVRINNYKTDTITKLVEGPCIHDLAVIRYTGDSTIEDGLKVGFDATVVGSLRDIRLTYEDTRPQTIQYITKEIRVEQKTYIPPSGIYIGAITSLPNSLRGISDLDVGPAVDVVLNKNIISYSYQFMNGIHLVGYKRKLF